MNNLQVLLRTALFVAIIGLFVGAVTPNSIIAPQTVKYQPTYFVAGTDAAGTYKTAYTGGTNGSKIVGIYVASTDGSVAHLVNIQVSSSTSSHCSPTNTSCSAGAAQTIPVSAGMIATAGVINMMAPGVWPGLPRDSDGNPYIYLTGSSQTLEATFATALTASTQVMVNVIAADF